MAKRYRYAFTKKKEAWRGKVSIGCAFASVLSFILALVTDVLQIKAVPHVVGFFCVLGALLSAYGFLEGILSFAEKDREHFTSAVGSIVCGIIVIIWLGLYLSGI